MHYTITNNFKFLLSTRVVSTIIKNSKISNKLWSLKIGSTDASYEFDETYYSTCIQKIRSQTTFFREMADTNIAI